MSAELYRQLNADLAYEFHLFTLEHPEWACKNLPEGAVVVLQTDDPAFNAWSRSAAERTGQEPNRPAVLVHIRELRPDQSRIVRADAEVFPQLLGEIQ